MSKLITPTRATKILTEEIIRQYKLPSHLCYNFIHKRFEWALGIGFNMGRSAVTKRKAVVSLDKNGRIVNAYESLHAAARDMNVAVQNISRAIHKEKTCAGLHWKFANPDDYYVYRKIK